MKGLWDIKEKPDANLVFLVVDLRRISHRRKLLLRNPRFLTLAMLVVFLHRETGVSPTPFLFESPFPCKKVKPEC